MFKSPARLFILGLIGALLVTPFQNCAKGGFESADLRSEMRASIQTPEDDPIPPIKEKVQTVYEPILADRRYLTSLLTDIFGPTTLAADTTQTETAVQTYGSPCSYLVDHNQFNATTNTWTQVSATENCSRVSLDHLTAPTNPKATVTRQALLTHACSDLTTNNGTLNYALAKISNPGVPAPTQANILKAYRLFYRDKPDPHLALTESLLVMLPTAAASVKADHWRTVIYTICASSFWQVL